MAASRSRSVWIALGVVAGAGVLWLIETGRFGWLPRCVFHEVTGLHCPGCGTTRALHALLHGQVGAALGLNLLTVLLLPLLGWWAFGRREILWKPWLGWTLLGVVVAFGVMRNVPQYPFTLLAP